MSTCQRCETINVPLPATVQVLRCATAAALTVLLGAAVYGHLQGSAVGLSLVHSYITEYMKLAPHWPWLTVASFAFAVSLQFLALGFVLRYQNRFLVVLGCLMLAAASMGNFFMAYAPVREAATLTDSSCRWWAPRWWFTAATARTPYDQGMADAYADVHYRAIRLVLTSGLLGMLFIGGGTYGEVSRQTLARATWVAVPLMAALFLLCDNIQEGRGGVQRAGFFVMYIWLWLAWYHCYHQFTGLPEPVRRGNVWQA